MSEPKNFLTRWSRRKREPVEKNAADEASAVADAPAGSETATSVSEGEVRSEFDISTLPSLDSIGASSDIRPFLQAGVPSALRHAALRRAWSADPAIRDFVALNENFWDAAGLDAAPGFSALDPSADVKKLLSQVFGGSEPEPQATTDVTSPPEESTCVVRHDKSALQRDENNNNIASQQYGTEFGESATAKARRHGGAMPR